MMHDTKVEVADTKKNANLHKTKNHESKSQATNYKPVKKTRIERQETSDH